MKKKLNMEGIANELAGGSAFFPSYDKQTYSVPSPTAAEPVRQAEAVSLQPKPAVTERPNAPTTVRPIGRRIITRNSFEIYEDQMDSLRQLSYREKMEGKLGSMSNMVREAIDEYLLKRN